MFTPFSDSVTAAVYWFSVQNIRYEPCKGYHSIWWCCIKNFTRLSHQKLISRRVGDFQGFIKHGAAFGQLLFGDDQGWNNQYRMPMRVKK